MARFRLFLIGAAVGIEVDLPAANISEVERDLSRQRHLHGRLADPDPCGTSPGFLVPAHRIQMIVEVC